VETADSVIIGTMRDMMEIDKPVFFVVEELVPELSIFPLLIDKITVHRDLDVRTLCRRILMRINHSPFREGTSWDDKDHGKKM
jgi:hypothetical protein